MTFNKINKLKKDKQHVINFWKNPFASLVYAVTLQHLKVRTTQSCQTANWHFLFPHERWAKETKTQWETLSLLCTIISSCTNKRTGKKRCVWADTYDSLLSYSQSTRFSHYNPLKMEKRKAMWEEDCRFPGQILKTSFPVSPMRILGPTF